MRTLHLPDNASALESLINLFMNKSHYATGQFSYKPLSMHLQILQLLFALQGELQQGKMSEISWRLLKYLHKLKYKHARVAPQPDLFDDSGSSATIPSIKGTQDYFYLEKGKILDEFSRFGEFADRFPGIITNSPLDLGTTKLEKVGTWFDNQSGDLMGAFLHLQMQDEKNPFGISLKLPPLEGKKLVAEFPFPCVAVEKKEVKEIRNGKKFDWGFLAKEYEENNGFPKFDPDSKRKLKMWENEEKGVRLQKSLKDLSKAYERSLIKKLDEQFMPSSRPLDSATFISNLKNLILGIPNRLFDQTYTPKFRFRLEGMSHSVILNLLNQILQFSKNYKFLSNLSTSLQIKRELISPSLSKGLKSVLSFIENYIIQVPDSTSLIQFVVQTQSLRDQVESLRTVCLELPSGFQIIDYIYTILTKNEGDFENYHLLQKLFKNIIQPILDSLTSFTFNAEIIDVYGEFFIQHNSEVAAAAEFSLNKFFKSFTSISNSIFAPVIEPLLDIGRNMRMMKQLEKDLSSYYQLLSSGTCSSLDPPGSTLPSFKLSYKTLKISKISDQFIAFNAEQTRCLLKLEDLLYNAEQVAKDRVKLAKEEKILKVKLASLAQKGAEAEIVKEKQRKQWNFAHTLENQLKENQELRRIENDRRLAEEKRLEEKLEQEKRDLIEKGRQFLIEQHEIQAFELYLRNAREEWRKNRAKLNEKRNKWILDLQEAEKNEIEGRMQVESIQAIEGFDNEDSPEILMALDEAKPADAPLQSSASLQTAAKAAASPEVLASGPLSSSNLHDPSTFKFKPVRQPPGGTSTISSLFNDPVSPKHSKFDPFLMPRIGYNANLEKWEICSSLLYEEVIKKVFRKITPVKSWDISAKNEDSNLFQDLFPDFQLKKNQSRNLVIPFNKVVEQLIVAPIRAQAEIVNKACLHLFIRKLKVIDHMKALKRYALLEAGDTIDLFLTTIFSSGFSGNLTAVWEGCLKMTSSRDDEYGEFIKISMKKNNLYRMQFKTVEDLEFLQLSYNVKGPLELIFSPDRIEEYSKAFTSLLRVKYITSILSNIKTFNVPMNHLYYRKIHFLRQKMQHFIDIYHGYVASELHGAAWKTLVGEVLKAQSLADIIRFHSKYLDIIQNRCFLKESGTRVMDQLKMIFQLVMRFRNIVIELDEFSLREIEVIEEDFNSIHRFLFKMTQKMAANGYFPELFIRLDFNEFMINKIDRERVL